MPAYWLTFRPLEESPKGWPQSNLRDLIARVENDPNTTEWWRVRSHQRASTGDRVYVFKQGTKSPRGIIGVGEIVGAPQYLATPNDREPTWRAEVRFQKLVDPAEEFLLPLSAIEDIVPPSLVNAMASGFSVPDDVAFELERLLVPALLGTQAILDGGLYDDPGFDPANIEDERERTLLAVFVRRGQPAFRSTLLKAYGGRCAVTGCHVEDILEAAHISPHGGASTNHVCNGLLLRTDVHTLFDCGLLAFHPKIWLSIQRQERLC